MAVLGLAHVAERAQGGLAVNLLRHRREDLHFQAVLVIDGLRAQPERLFGRGRLLERLDIIARFRQRLPNEYS